MPSIGFFTFTVVNNPHCLPVTEALLPCIIEVTGLFSLAKQR
jgi:hypothetical protein